MIDLTNWQDLVVSAVAFGAAVVIARPFLPGLRGRAPAAPANPACAACAASHAAPPRTSVAPAAILPPRSPKPSRDA